MNLIFLDVDGVLNGEKCSVKTSSGYAFVEDALVGKLKTITDATGAKVILSSSWRRGYYDICRGIMDTKDARDYIQLKEKLSGAGIRVVGVTPLSQAGNRGLEIKCFLEGIEPNYLTSYIILDDDDSDLGCFTGRVVLTSHVTGLCDSDVQKAIELLKH